MASKRVGFGTQSLLEQWRDSYGNGDYNDDPYDDDMYEGHDLSQDLQAICDNLDIRVQGRILKNLLTGFRNCTIRSHYRSISKQTTWYSILIPAAMSCKAVRTSLSVPSLNL
ncbi:hypothetical protein Tco_0461931 [Tanacetum coccineum]